MLKSLLASKSNPYKPINGVGIRCLECLAHIDVAPNAKEVECPNCHTRFLVYWPTPDIAKIKGVAHEKVPLS
jgi:DNA-directed RNA polymerase subunit RPC12/RpoP